MKNITRKLVALSVLVTGTIAIAPNQAQAQARAELCLSSNGIPSGIVECGDKEFSNFTSNLPNLQTLEVGINLAENYEVIAQVQPSVGAGTYTLTYDVEITSPNRFFDEVALDSVVDPLGAIEEVTKEVTFAGAGSPIILTSESGSPDTASFPSGVTSISVVDTIFVPQGGNFDAVENDFNQEVVPEPITILGSLAALGFGTVLKGQQKKKNG
jgi:hypothetical protein